MQTQLKNRVQHKIENASTTKIPQVIRICSSTQLMIGWMI